MKEISLTDKIRYEYELRLKAKRDREAEDGFVYGQGREDGIKIGRKDGIKIGQEKEKEKNIEILISTLRGHGLTDAQIASDLMEKYGLSKEEAEEKIKS